MLRILSGIQPSGVLHIGNYFGMMRPAIELQKEGETFYFIADYHALTSVRNPEALRENSRRVALDCWRDRKSVVEGVTGVQTCALRISPEGGRDILFHRRLSRPHQRAQSGSAPRKFTASRARLLERSEERRGGSDWSSDVCSSDLSRRRARHSIPSPIITPSPACAIRKRSAKIHGESRSTFGEIGRASWRE